MAKIRDDRQIKKCEDNLSKKRSKRNEPGQKKKTAWWWCARKDTAVGGTWRASQVSWSSTAICKVSSCWLTDSWDFGGLKSSGAPRQRGGLVWVRREGVFGVSGRGGVAETWLHSGACSWKSRGCRLPSKRDGGELHRAVGVWPLRRFANMVRLTTASSCFVLADLTFRYWQIFWICALSVKA